MGNHSHTKYGERKMGVGGDCECWDLGRSMKEAVVSRKSHRNLHWAPCACRHRTGLHEAGQRAALEILILN